MVLLPGYLVAGLPGLRATARRLGLVTLSQMIQSLTFSIEHPADGVRVIEVPQIRRLRP